MTAVEFPQQNTVLAKDQPQYQPLPVLFEPEKEGQPMTCCFELSTEELREINATRRIWHNQLTFGHAFQPIRMTTGSPFIQEGEELPRPEVTMQGIKDINIATQDGLLLMAAVAMISSRDMTDKTPDQVLDHLKGVAAAMV